MALHRPVFDILGPNRYGHRFSWDNDLVFPESSRRALELFNLYSKMDEYQSECKLEKGDIIIFDNKRIRHGRREICTASTRKFRRAWILDEESSGSVSTVLDKTFAPPNPNGRKDISFLFEKYAPISSQFRLPDVSSIETGISIDEKLNRKLRRILSQDLTSRKYIGQ